MRPLAYWYLSGHSEPRRRRRWKTLVHQTTTARRVMGRRLVNHAR